MVVSIKIAHSKGKVNIILIAHLTLTEWQCLKQTNASPCKFIFVNLFNNIRIRPVNLFNNISVIKINNSNKFIFSGLGKDMVFNATFNNISAISVFQDWQKSLTKIKDWNIFHLYEKSYCTLSVKRQIVGFMERSRFQLTIYLTRWVQLHHWGSLP